MHSRLIITVDLERHICGKRKPSVVAFFCTIRIRICFCSFIYRKRFRGHTINYCTKDIIFCLKHLLSIRTNERSNLYPKAHNTATKTMGRYNKRKMLPPDDCMDSICTERRREGDSSILIV